MSVRIATRIRVILHDVSGAQPTYLGSCTVELDSLPVAVWRWLKKMPPDTWAGGKNPPKAAPIAGKKDRTGKVKGQRQKQPGPKKKGGRRGNAKA